MLNGVSRTGRKIRAGDADNTAAGPAGPSNKRGWMQRMQRRSTQTLLCVAVAVQQMAPTQAAPSALLSSASRREVDCTEIPDGRFFECAVSPGCHFDWTLNGEIGGCRKRRCGDTELHHNSTDCDATEGCVYDAALEACHNVNRPPATKPCSSHDQYNINACTSSASGCIFINEYDNHLHRCYAEGDVTDLPCWSFKHSGSCPPDRCSFADNTCVPGATSTAPTTSSTATTVPCPASLASPADECQQQGVECCHTLNDVCTFDYYQRGCRARGCLDKDERNCATDSSCDFDEESKICFNIADGIPCRLMYGSDGAKCNKAEDCKFVDYGHLGWSCVGNNEQLLCDAFSSAKDECDKLGPNHGHCAYDSESQRCVTTTTTTTTTTPTSTVSSTATVTAASSASTTPTTTATSTVVVNCHKCELGTHGPCLVDKDPRLCVAYASVDGGAGVCPSETHECADGNLLTWVTSPSTTASTTGASLPSKRLCGDCTFGTSGPCKALGSGVCVDYDDGADNCPEETESCWSPSATTTATSSPTSTGTSTATTTATSTATSASASCAECEYGTSGPCILPTSRVCTEFVDPDARTCPDEMVRCYKVKDAAENATFYMPTTTSPEPRANGTEPLYKMCSGCKFGTSGACKHDFIDDLCANPTLNTYDCPDAFTLCGTTTTSTTTSITETTSTTDSACNACAKRTSGPCMIPGLNEKDNVCFGYEDEATLSCPAGSQRCFGGKPLDTSTATTTTTTTTSGACPDHICSYGTSGDCTSVNIPGVCAFKAVTAESDGAFVCPNGFEECMTTTPTTTETSTPTSTAESTVTTTGTSTGTSTATTEQRLCKEIEVCKFGTSGPCVEVDSGVCANYADAEGTVCPAGMVECVGKRPPPASLTTSEATTTTRVLTACEAAGQECKFETSGDCRNNDVESVLFGFCVGVDEEGSDDGSCPDEFEKCEVTTHTSTATSTATSSATSTGASTATSTGITTATSTPTSTVAFDTMCKKDLCKFGTSGPCIFVEANVCASYNDAVAETCPDRLVACQRNGELPSADPADLTTSTTATTENVYACTV